MWRCSNCGEINPDSSALCQSCAAKNFNKTAVINRSVEMQRRQEENRRNEEARREEEMRRIHASYTPVATNANVSDESYEFKLINIYDTTKGAFDAEVLSQRLNELGKQGWYLKGTISNVVILERKVKNN